jgi:hypothetical protein
MDVMLILIMAGNVKVKQPLVAVPSFTNVCQLVQKLLGVTHTHTSQYYTLILFLLTE